MKKLILIVEDDRQYREILQSQLKDAGYDVVTAVNGQEGLKMVEKHDLNLILLDLLMPKVDGVEFYHKLAEKLKKKIPVIVLTNVSDATGYDADIKDVLIKSNVSLAQVIEKVKKEIE